MPYLIALICLAFQLTAPWPSLQLWPIDSENFGAWQLLTYQFQHGGWFHLILNLVAVLSFGPPVQRQVGRAAFVLYFLAAGVVGGCAQLAMMPTVPLVGASASVFGIFAFFCCQAHDGKVISPFLVPMPAWVVLVLYAILSAVCIAQGWLTSVAHAAHLGGMVVGLAMAVTTKSPRHL